MMSLSVSSVWRRGPSSWRTSSRRVPSACTALSQCNTTYCVSCTTFPFWLSSLSTRDLSAFRSVPLSGGSDGAGLFFLLQSSNTQFILHLPINNRQWKHTSASVSANSPFVCHCLQQTRRLPKKLHIRAASWVIFLAVGGGGQLFGSTNQFLKNTTAWNTTALFTALTSSFAPPQISSSFLELATSHWIIPWGELFSFCSSVLRNFLWRIWTLEGSSQAAFPHGGFTALIHTRKLQIH